MKKGLTNPVPENGMADAYDALKNRFTYHPPTSEQTVKYQELRRNAFNLAILINALVPDSREKSLSLTKLEEAIFWANAGIARNNDRPLPS